MWQPEPGWHPLPGRHRDVHGGRLADRARWPAGRRQAARGAHRQDPAELSDPRHFAYWRRAADVVTARVGLDATPGLRAPRLTSVEEDAEGITLVQDWVEDAANSGLFCAVSLGRFAGADLGDHAWLARGPAPRPDGARRSAAVAGRPWPGPRWLTSPTTSGGAAPRCWTSSTRCRR